MNKIVVIVGLALAAVTSGCIGFGSYSRSPDRPAWDVGLINKYKVQDLTLMKQHVKDGKVLNYRIHSPTVRAKTKYPLFIFLHGAGERGDNNTAQLLHGVSDIVKYAMKHGDAFVIAPQCPAGHKWVNVDWSKNTMRQPETPSVDLELVMDLVDGMIAGNPAIDRDRIYVSGISMGGFGTWDYLYRRPELFAAAMPICGGVDPAIAPVVKDVPTRFFHGDVDGAVPVEYSRRMAAALKAVKAKAEYTEYPNVNHDCWTRTYADAEVLKWIFSQSK